MSETWLAQSGPVPIAHRGGAHEQDENTRAAFAHAAALGFRHVETDVHLTADGEVVIHHDPTLKRMTGDPRPVSTLTWAQLSRLRTRSDAGIPRLADMLEEFPRLLFNIETKSDAVVDPLAALLRKMGVAHRIGTGSFATARTQRLRAHFGDALCWSPGYGGVAKLWAAGWGAPIPRPAFPMVQVPPLYRGIRVVTPRFVRAAHKRGVRVQVWTVDDPAQMQALLDMGVDAIMTDRPSVLKEVLVARGEWRGSDA